MSKSQYKDVLWHSAKALLCSLQLWLLSLVVRSATAQLLEFLLREHAIVDEQAPLLSIVPPVAILALFFALAWYYDSIDDRSFNRFCDAPEIPVLLRDYGFVSEIALTLLTATPILTASLYIPFLYLGLRVGEAIAVAILISTVIIGGYSVLRVKRLQDTWEIQKDLRTGNEKTPRVIKRVIYAIIFYISLYLLVVVCLSVLPVWGAFFVALGKLLMIPCLVVAGGLFLWLVVINGLRQLSARHKFMRRLRRLRDKGELSFEVHGHPYLSVFSTRVFFGLTIVDAPHPDGRKRTDTTYKIAFANCKRRRFTVVLCDRNIYQFVYTLQFSQISRFGRMGAAAGSHAGRIISVPGASWYSSHAFEFPEGEGERILLVDPTPHILALHGQRAGELQELDNDSKVFGYTVYGKNSFLNLLERI